MKLYALCDQNMLDSRGVSLESFLDIAKKNKAYIVQYRNKTADVSFIKKQLIKIRQKYEGFLIINDTYELVDLCDGVHLGQEDLKLLDNDNLKAIKIIRDIIGKEKILGISTHNKKEVIEANDMDLNYIGLGAYRDTTTKNDINKILGDSLDNIASYSKHQVAAIGGVKLSDKFEHVEYKVIGSGLL